MNIKVHKPEWIKDGHTRVVVVDGMAYLCDFRKAIALPCEVVGDEVVIDDAGFLPHESNALYAQEVRARKDWMVR